MDIMLFQNLEHLDSAAQCIFHFIASIAAIRALNQILAGINAQTKRAILIVLVKSSIQESIGFLIAHRLDVTGRVFFLTEMRSAHAARPFCCFIFLSQFSLRPVIIRHGIRHNKLFVRNLRRERIRSSRGFRLVLREAQRGFNRLIIPLDRLCSVVFDIAQVNFNPIVFGLRNALSGICVRALCTVQNVLEYEGVIFLLIVQGRSVGRRRLRCRSRLCRCSRLRRGLGGSCRALGFIAAAEQSIDKRISVRNFIHLLFLSFLLFLLRLGRLLHSAGVSFRNHNFRLVIVIVHAVLLNSGFLYLLFLASLFSFLCGFFMFTVCFICAVCFRFIQPSKQAVQTAVLRHNS